MIKNVKLLSFYLCVIVPTALSCAYLYLIAVDQYATRFALLLREDENSISQTLSLTGAPRQSDTALIAHFLHAPNSAQHFAQVLPLIEHYSSPADPIFALQSNASFEDFGRYWERKVRPVLDPRHGILDVEVRAFSAQMAYQLAQTIIDDSNARINALLHEARQSVAQAAEQDLIFATERLARAEYRLEAARHQSGTLDNTLEVNAAQSRLADLQATLQSLVLERAEITTPTPRIRALDHQISTIEASISQTRESLRETLSNRHSFTRLEREVLAAETAFLRATEEADRASYLASQDGRYLVLFMPPELPQTPLYPKRLTLLFLIGLTCLFLWALAVIVQGAIAERR